MRDRDDASGERILEAIDDTAARIITIRDIRIATSGQSPEEIDLMRLIARFRNAEDVVCRNKNGR